MVCYGISGVVNLAGKLKNFFSQQFFFFNQGFMLFL